MNRAFEHRDIAASAEAQTALAELQFPDRSSRDGRLLLVHYQRKVGLASELHGIMLALSFAFSTGRTLVVAESAGWGYDTGGTSGYSRRSSSEFPAAVEPFSFVQPAVAFHRSDERTSVAATVAIIRDLVALSQMDAIIVTFTSNVGRLAAELGFSNGRHRLPAVSLDGPWKAVP